MYIINHLVRLIYSVHPFVLKQFFLIQTSGLGHETKVKPQKPYHNITKSNAKRRSK